MDTKTATLSDVAAHAGVSPMTVSRVINGEQNVRSETREKVQKSIDALTYRPNLSARALAGSRSYKLVLLYGNPSAFYLSELLVGALEEISDLGHQLLVHKISDTATQDEIKERLTALLGAYDGVIVPPPLSDYQTVRKFLKSNDIPAILLSGDEGKGRSQKICIDDYKAAKEITEYLLGLGHKRIAFIKGNPNQHASAERLRGYEKALTENGVNREKSWVAPGQFTYASGVKAGERLLSLSEPPTAVFASNDDMAAAVLAVAASKGIKVPEELSVVGFDDSPLASSVFPRLTTVRQPLTQMARSAVNSLIELIRKSPDPSAPKRLTMSYQIIFGDSTTSAPGSKAP